MQLANNTTLEESLKTMLFNIHRIHIFLMILLLSLKKLCLLSTYQGEREKQS